MFCAILTLFPDAVKPYLDESILGIAQDLGKSQAAVRKMLSRARARLGILLEGA